LSFGSIACNFVEPQRLVVRWIAAAIAASG